MRIWKAIFSVLTIIFGSLGLINIVSTDYVCLYGINYVDKCKGVL